MGVTLEDLDESPATGDRRTLSLNWWHWRAIVEAIRRLKLLDDEKVDALHEPYSPEACLSDRQARQVASAIRDQLLPALMAHERLLLDGHVTDEPDDGTFHRTPQTLDQNYSTDRQMLETFADYCESCKGFSVS